MVYCGKPSRACLECRLKRRKCDLSKPSCGQCARARSTCSGYRDQVALTFRDQSMDVARRAHPFDNQCKRSIPPDRREVSHIRKRPLLRAVATKDVEKHPDHVLYSGVSFPLENQASGFFFHHYILNDAYFSTNHDDWFVVICARPSAHSYLFNIIDAIGIASLSNFKREPGLMYAASRKYSLALEKLRVGLEEPAEVLSDQMLFSVMLFALYELVTYNISRGNISGTSHLDGALVLLQLRGLDQLNTKTGRYLFYRVLMTVLINCLQRNTPVPEVMLNWVSEAQKFETGGNNPFLSLAKIIFNICAFRETIESCYSLETVDKPDLHPYISAAVSIDADLARWSTNLPPVYSYSTMRMPVELEDLYSGLYHNYSDLWTANTWNLYRCARILLNQRLIWLLPSNHQLVSSTPETSSYRRLLDVSQATIHECSTGILLSAPFILSGLQKERGTSSNVQAIYGLSLLWPLCVAGVACPRQSSVREGAILLLERIGDITGIQRANIMAMMLRKLESRDHSRSEIAALIETSLGGYRTRVSRIV